MQAAVGLAQLKRLANRTDRLRQIYRLYCHHLSEVTHVKLLPFDVDGGETPQWVDVLASDRDALVRYLEARGVHCRPFWYPIHTQQPYRQSDAAFPHATRVAPDAVWLPSAFSLSDDDVVTVCANIRQFYQARA